MQPTGSFCPAPDLISARMNAAIGGFGGEFVETHALDAKTAKRFPKRMIGLTLAASESAALLDGPS
jgi:hypothetical protein